MGSSEGFTGEVMGENTVNEHSLPAVDCLAPVQVTHAYQPEGIPPAPDELSPIGWLGNQMLTHSLADRPPLEPKIPLTERRIKPSIYTVPHHGMTKEFDDFCKMLCEVGMIGIFGDAWPRSDLTASPEEVEARRSSSRET